jgi:hypothetical protein
MVKQEDIERLINVHLNQLLIVAETALPASQFQAFRKFTLNEFGKNGLGKELERLYNGTQNKER